MIKLNVCHCPKCHDQPPIFKPVKNEYTGDVQIYGVCPKCGFEACFGGSTTQEAADGWNKSVRFFTEILFDKITKTGLYAEAES